MAGKNIHKTKNFYLNRNHLIYFLFRYLDPSYILESNSVQPADFQPSDQPFQTISNPFNIDLTSGVSSQTLPSNNEISNQQNLNIPTNAETSNQQNTPLTVSERPPLIDLTITPSHEGSNGNSAGLSAAPILEPGHPVQSGFVPAPSDTTSGDFFYVFFLLYTKVTR